MSVSGDLSLEASGHVACVIENGVARVRLTRPDRLNALSEPMKDELTRLFRMIGGDPDIRVVVLSAEGKTFCASGDVTTMGDFTPVSARDRLKRAHGMIIALANIEKPVIACVRGKVAGIGWSMALAADLIIASDTAEFSQVFRNVGLSPDGGAIYFLCRALGEVRARELVYLGRKVKAEEAMQLNIINRLVSDASLDAEADALAEEMAASPLHAMATTKKMFKAMHSPSLETFLDMEAWAQATNLLTEDHKEGIAAFLGKRLPNFTGR